MSGENVELAGELRQLWHEFEKLIGLARSTVSEHTEELAGQVRGGLDHARDHLRRRAQAADQYVRDNALAIIAVTAVTAFVAGLVLGRRR